ncbi:regulatory protein [Thecaphora frezii]
MLQPSHHPGHSFDMVESYRLQRNQVLSRRPHLDLEHAGSGLSQGVLEASFPARRRARDHPRWASLQPESSPHPQKYTAAPKEASSARESAPSSASGRFDFGPNYIPEEQTLRNDYSQHFVDTNAGKLPGDAVRNPHQETRFDEYPKLKRLVQIKDSLVTLAAHPPTYLCADLRQSLIPYHASAARRGRQNHLQPNQQPAASAGPSRTGATFKSTMPQSPHPISSELQNGAGRDDVLDASPSVGKAETATEEVEATTAVSGTADESPRAAFHLGSLMPIKYDVVLIDPPLETYEWEEIPSPGGAGCGSWSWDEIAALPVPQVAAKESFVFLWTGSGAGDGLERGREVLSRWGYRRCEDIVWVRTNPGGAAGQAQQSSTGSAFTRCVQHCLMGIRGTVRRSTDTRFVHCNVDTDVILWPGDEEPQATSHAAGDISIATPDMRSKPPELYNLIENFCLGTRRLELFGRNRNLRRGWLTIGLELGPEAPGWPDNGVVPVPRNAILEQQQQEAGSNTHAPLAENSGLQDHLAKLSRVVEYDKLTYDPHFGVDRPGCELRDRINLIPFSEEGEMLRPKSPPPRGAGAGAGNVGGNNGGGGTTAAQGGRGGVGNGTTSGSGGYTAIGGYGGGMPPHPGMPSGLSADRALRVPIKVYDAHRLEASAAMGGMMGMGMGMAGSMYGRPVGGGAGLSGLGAGGARTVSVPSGSDTLSGPQASVLKAKVAAEAAQAQAQAQAQTQQGSASAKESEAARDVLDHH